MNKILLALLLLFSNYGYGQSKKEIEWKRYFTKFTTAFNNKDASQIAELTSKDFFQVNVTLIVIVCQLLLGHYIFLVKMGKNNI
jgi:hypothetical protein